MLALILNTAAQHAIFRSKLDLSRYTSRCGRETRSMKLHMNQCIPDYHERLEAVKRVHAATTPTIVQKPSSITSLVFVQRLQLAPPVA